MIKILYIFCWFEIGTFVVAVATAAALIFHALQYRNAKKVNTANLWLKIEDLFSIPRREKIHLKIMDQKFDHTKNFHEQNDSYWLDDYLGIFEICFSMIKKHVIDVETFNAVYKYRLRYFLAYEMIVKEKLIKEGKDYEKLYALLSKLSGNDWNEFWKKYIKGQKIDDATADSLYEKLKIELINSFLNKK
jgi:hypothetical protein